MADSNTGPIFTDQDVQRLLAEERGEGEGGWTLANRSENVEVWRKSLEGVGINLMKGFLSFPGIPFTAVVDMLQDLKRRTEWDSIFIQMEVLEEIDDYKVVYWRSKMPSPVTDRSLIQYIKHIDVRDNNMHIILYKHYPGEHPNAPDSSDTVRAETIFSGVIIRPDADRPDSSQLSLLFQTDLKGWIPNFIVNALSSRSPKQWRENLTEFYRTAYNK